MADNGTPLILLTRPRPQSERFAARLPHGLMVRIAPLQEIIPTQAMPVMTDITDLIFTSETAVSIAARHTSRRDLTAWCVGDRTAQVARAAGFDAQSAAGTAKDLVALIAKSHPHGRFLHLHGHHTRGDVAGALVSKGMSAKGAELYEQRAVTPPPAIAELAVTGKVLAPLFSPRSAALFADAIGAAEGAWFPLCLSPAVRDQLPLHLQNNAAISQAPTADAMLRLLNRYISP